MGPPLYLEVTKGLARIAVVSAEKGPLELISWSIESSAFPSSRATARPVLMTSFTASSLYSRVNSRRVLAMMNILFCEVSTQRGQGHAFVLASTREWRERTAHFVTRTRQSLMEQYLRESILCLRC
jgi:hypothetical protein